MNVSRRGIEIIKQFEGFKADAYPDPGTGGEPWTIGYGTTKGIRPGMTVTQEQATAFLARDVALFSAEVERLVKVPLTQNQHDALVSLVYNIGPGAFAKSTLLKKLNAGRYDDVPSEMARWNKAGGRVLNGLVRRRAAEAELWNDTDVAGMPQAVQASDPPPRQSVGVTAAVATAAPAASAAAGVLGVAQSPTVQIVLILVAVALAVGAFVAWKKGLFA